MERTLIDWMFECPYLTTICVIVIAACIGNFSLVKVIRVNGNRMKGNKEAKQDAENHD